MYMIADIHTKISEFAQAIGIDSQIIINFIQKWSNEDGYEAHLTKLKIDYVNKCVIGKKCIDTFQLELALKHSRAENLKGRLDDILNQYNLEIGNPLTYIILNKLNDHQEMYYRILQSMKESNRDIAKDSLDKLLNAYAFHMMKDMDEIDE